ncbi:preprotein translocase subunit SecD [Candidatus Kinetoplastibacterium oncopeltii TCC290E]|uniref:Protein translocase subunit SecD n=1 Tax=Candidatus Kinetoplastidibacterium stringomonadis TCC290E TaxID=1208920 RepID=M1L6B4_9PROT|nr:protein translocase subunit SecD [Candidatus Kinetoplastibacterium oncopeltii]AGF48143.1 preprotein translocase subunit SecD [Candidatus Kinetoplastibacterium oncopeltii TCC290E]
MNRYPAWKNLLITFAVLVGVIYMAPNFYELVPFIQISETRTQKKIDSIFLEKIKNIISDSNLKKYSLSIETDNSVKINLFSAEDQSFLLEKLDKNLNKDSNKINIYNITVGMNSITPGFMRIFDFIGAKPMSLGLDLRGGVHFLIEVDTEAAVESKYDETAMEVRSILNRKKIISKVERNRGEILVKFNKLTDKNETIKNIKKQWQDDDLFIEESRQNQSSIKISFSKKFLEKIKTNAVSQNISTLNKRISGISDSEPIIQQQGSKRIIVQLPGKQDISKAKDLIGRTAKLEVRMVDDTHSTKNLFKKGGLPFGIENIKDHNGNNTFIYKHPILTSSNIKDAHYGRDPQTRQPSVNLTLDSKGARIFKDVTRDNINKRMAIILFENGIGEIITAPFIRSEISGGQVQISGAMSPEEAAEISVLLRSGLLAAPMKIIEEKTIGPSLGLNNIEKGLKSTIYGFISVVFFITIYYGVFGLFSSIGLIINLILLVALLSVLQVSINLPGIAAIALTVGMAIDSNVLINERIREELRNGNNPQESIYYGFKRAWSTILDSNFTALIVGLSLLTLGSGTVRGFAIVHCLGIITSMFSSVLCVRMMVNFWYGKRANLSKISIGEVWKPKKNN